MPPLGLRNPTQTGLSNVLALDGNRLQMWLSVTEVNDQLLGLAGVKEKAVPLAPVAEGSRQVPVLPLLLLPHTPL